MKKFIKLETILTEEQVAKIIEHTKYSAQDVRTSLIHRLHSGYCSASCGEIATVGAIFERELNNGEIAIMQEKYCKDCIKNERHLKPRENEINQSNLSDYFTPITPEEHKRLRLKEREQLKLEKNPMSINRYRKVILFNTNTCE